MKLWWGVAGPETQRDGVAAAAQRALLRWSKGRRRLGFARWRVEWMGCRGVTGRFKIQQPMDPRRAGLQGRSRESRADVAAGRLRERDAEGMKLAGGLGAQ
jgi:hypothetical protein